VNKKWIALAAAVCLLFVAAAGVHGQLAKGTLAVSIDSASSESRMSAENKEMMISLQIEEGETGDETEDGPFLGELNPFIVTPDVEEPETNEPVVEEPTPEEPEADEPVVEEPTPEEPEADEPVVEEPTPEEPEADEPVVEEPTPEEPEADEPVVEEPTPEEPEADEPVVEEPEVDDNITIIAPLSAAMTASADYVNVGETISATVSVSGGVAPYQVKLGVGLDGMLLYRENHELAENQSQSISYETAEPGAYHIYANVTDAEGNETSASVRIGARSRTMDLKDDAKWQALAEAVSLTGDWRMDVLMVAQSQLGYTENESDFIIENDQVSGYTMYGEWVGNAYADWCAAFIGWCFDQADTDMDLRLASVDSWVKKMKAYDAFRDADYAPEAGDIVFLIPNDETKIGHIGLVEYVTGNVMGTIEANVGNMVDQRTYQLGDEAIGGYASMTALMDAMNVEYSGSASAYDVEDVEDFTGYLNTDKVNLRNGPSTQTMVKAVLTGIGSPLNVMARVENEGETWYLLEGEDVYGMQTGYMMAKFVDGTVPSTDVNYALVLEVEEDVVEVTAASDNLQMYEANLVEAEEIPVEIQEWIEVYNPTQEMIDRALAAPSLESLVIEDSDVVYVRTGAVMAYYDAESNFIIDKNTGLIVAQVDMETGVIQSLAATEESAE